MKKLLKALGVLLLFVLGLLLTGIAYIKIALPNVGPAPTLTAEPTPARLERGRYLAQHVMGCVGCHSTRIASEYAMPVDSSSYGIGGEEFNRERGFPGNYYAPNITPAGIGGWTDGEIFRAVTTGVRKNGKPIFPVMPYLSYGQVAPEDIQSVIAYLRTLSSKPSHVPASTSDFPMNIILNTIPSKENPGTIPSASDPIASGKYLIALAACDHCHTPVKKGKMIESLRFAGGRSFPMPGGTAYSANLTPDKETGTGNWTAAAFIARFAAYRDHATAHRPVQPGEPQTMMPWSQYAGMTDTDLGNIYAYLQSIQPIKHAVVKFIANKP